MSCSTPKLSVLIIDLIHMRGRNSLELLQSARAAWGMRGGAGGGAVDGASQGGWLPCPSSGACREPVGLASARASQASVCSVGLVRVASGAPFSGPHAMLFLLRLELFSVSAVITALTLQCQRVALQVAFSHEVIRRA